MARLWEGTSLEVYMTIKRMVFRVAAAGALLVAPGVAWDGPLPTPGAVHHCDQADDRPVITGEGDFGTTSAHEYTAGGTDTAPPSSNAIVVSDPGPGDGGGPK